MSINLLAIVLASIIQMGIGMLWYGPLMFERKWTSFMGVSKKTDSEPDSKNTVPAALLISQFLFSLAMNTALAYAVSLNFASGLRTAIMIWMGFIVPIQAGVLWSGGPLKMRREMFLIMTGYQLLCMLVAGFILQWWK